MQTEAIILAIMIGGPIIIFVAAEIEKEKQLYEMFRSYWRRRKTK